MDVNRMKGLADAGRWEDRAVPPMRILPVPAVALVDGAGERGPRKYRGNDNEKRREMHLVI